jgi:hypothetical protein
MKTFQVMSHVYFGKAVCLSDLLPEVVNICDKNLESL